MEHLLIAMGDPNDPKRVFGSACGFLGAAERCLEERPGTRPGVTEVFPIQSAVLAAFALELYLKANLLAQKCEARGHDLVALFEALGAARRQSVIAATQRGDGEFRERLVNVSRVFVSWRYVHETPTTVMRNKEFLLELAKVLDRLGIDDL